MICRCCAPPAEFAAALRRAAAAARTIVGAPDYEAYVAHLRATHPDLEIPTRARFFQERMVGQGRMTGRFRCC